MSSPRSGCEILCIGTELLLGNILNGNARWLAESLASLGIPHFRQGVVGDNPERVREAPPPRVAASELPPNPTMEVVERVYILWVLQAEGGNKTRAAEVLGIDPSTLYRKLNRYGLESA